MFWNVGLTTDNQRKILLLLAIMFSAMLLPAFTLTSSLPNLRPDEFLIFGAYLLNVMVYLFQGKRRPKLSGNTEALSKVKRVFLLLLGSYIVSNLYAGVVLKVPFGLRDLMECVTVAKYYLIIALVINTHFGSQELKLLKKGLVVALALIAVVSWGQYWNLLDMNSWLTPFLAPGHLDNLVGANPPRVLGTFDNPNMSGIFAVIVFCFGLSYYYLNRDGRKSDLVYLLVSAFSIKLAFFTISRMSVICGVIAFLFITGLALTLTSDKRKLLAKIGIVALVVAFLVVTSPNYFMARMVEGTNFQTSTSVQGHTQRGAAAVNIAKGSPILGWGTAKSTMTTLVDSEYLLISRRYGLVGLALYIWFFLKPALLAIKRRGTDSQGIWALSFAAATIAVMVSNTTSGLLYNLQVMTLFSALMGSIYLISTAAPTSMEESNRGYALRR